MKASIEVVYFAERLRTDQSPATLGLEVGSVGQTRRGGLGGGRGGGGENGRRHRDGEEFHGRSPSLEQG